MKSVTLFLLVSLLLLSQPLYTSRGGVKAEEDDYEDDDNQLEPLDDLEDETTLDDEASLEDESSLDDEYVEDDDEEYGDEESEESDSDADSGDEGDNGFVLSLTAESFKETVKAHHAVMVEFYAPWCGHCKALTPEYRSAAEVLKADNVRLAKVDATRETELAEEYGVEGFPTIMFFIDGVSYPYNKGRTSADIVAWVRRKLGPKVETLLTKEDVDRVWEEANVLAAAFFRELEGSEYDEYQAAAVDEDITFVQTTNPEVAAVLFEDIPDHYVKAPAVALMKDEDERVVKFEGPFEKAALLAFYEANKLPLVITFSEATSQKIFGSQIKKQMLLFVDDAHYEAHIPMFTEVAREFREIIFVHINSTDSESSSSILEYFGVGITDVRVIGYHSSEDEGAKYNFEDELTEDNLLAFAAKFHDGTAERSFKSEPEPETNDGDVKVVVGTSFDKIVMDEAKDVLLEVYAPWCGHCKKLAPIYEKLARRVRAVDSVVIAKIDGTENEHQYLKGVEGFPTIFLYPAGDRSRKEAPILAEDRTLSGLTRFLKKYASVPFTLPKKGDLLKQAGSPEEAAELEEAAAQEVERGAEQAEEGLKEEL
eukprot:TRINITY_DN22210_c0_g1_i1.p1 TRINITY_DN22210_c0_g1~~TRINITY_DN22210_c0_g1_i1.p1  ORF type:complete len:596 (+),score=161.63 TRINITY_DN22210_c0_g1_i1:237-2024(+)